MRRRISPSRKVKRCSASVTQYQSEESSTSARKRCSLSRSAASARLRSVMSLITVSTAGRPSQSTLFVGNLHPARVARARQDADVVSRLERFAGGAAAMPLADQLAVLREDERREFPALKLLERVADQLERPGIGVGEAPVLQDQDALHHRCGQRAVALLALAQRGLGAPALGDVDPDDQQDALAASPRSPPRTTGCRRSPRPCAAPWR
jgi:hypothetical protein